MEARYRAYLADAVKRVGHGSTTGSHDLERVGQGVFRKGWLGVVPRDMIPARRPSSYLICNLDTSRGPGTHWVCRYVDGRGKAAWHDPLGHTGVAQAGALREQLGSVEWTDDDAEQKQSEDNCGQRCLAALMAAKAGGMVDFMAL